MSFLFASRKTQQEKLRKYQRDLDRKLRKLDQKEKNITVYMQKMAKRSRWDAVYVMAKGLLRIRHNIDQCHMIHIKITTTSIETLTTRQAKDVVREIKRAIGSMNDAYEDEDDEARVNEVVNKFRDGHRIEADIQTRLEDLRRE